MSSHANVQAPVHAPSDPGRLPMTLPLLAEKKRLREPIVMVTAYDYPSARAAEAAGVDLVLVGDSAATTVLGYNATTQQFNCYNPWGFTQQLTWAQVSSNFGYWTENG